MHNYTRDITATRPENFAELTEEEKALIKKLGVYIKDCGTGGLGATYFFLSFGRRQDRLGVLLGYVVGYGYVSCIRPASF